ncbi:glutathione S-transferase [Vibrio tubiashii]|nr:glutathione S-transferase [Vibrio tubiashii]
MIKLYWHPLSGHAHRAQMLIHILGLEHELIVVDLIAGEQRQPEFLALNPFGQVPVLVDGETVIFDSNAILVYLATMYDKQKKWLPDSPKERAQIEQFLSLAACRLAGSVAKLRAANLFNRSIDSDALTKEANTLFAQLDGYQRNRQWLVGEQPSIADLALYTYIKLAPEGGVSLEHYPDLQAWIRRVEALPDFIPMQLSNVGLRQKMPSTDTIEM